MAEANLPSRFVSQIEIEETNQRKEDAWKAAYARIGQEPPKLSATEAYDGRSLAEKLAANKAAKQEEYENAHKLSAQFRALDQDEIGFLDEVALKRLEDEKRVKEDEQEELKGWRAAVQARDASLSNPPVASSSTSTAKPPSPEVPKPTASKPAAKNPVKAGLKGLVVAKKRNRPDTRTGESTKSAAKTTSTEDVGLQKDGDGSVPTKDVAKGKELNDATKADGEEGGDRKRRRVE